MTELLLAFWYFLPAGFGNMTPIFASKLPGLRRWNTQIDGGRKFRGHEILGSHKTVRGFVTGVTIGVLVGAVQKSLAGIFDFGQFNELYVGWAPIYLGGLLAFGALFGDALKSFFKRQFGVASGDSWFPFDQLDYILGACIFGALIRVLDFGVYAWILLIWFGLHLLTSYLGYRLKLKSKPI